MNQASSDKAYLRPQEWVQRVLRDRIASRMYPPGSHLPSERVLAEEMRVARMTARSAINSLVEEGLVTREAGRGTVVVERSRQEDSLQVGVVHCAPELTAWPESATILRGVTDRLLELGYPAKMMAYGGYDAEARRFSDALSTPILSVEDIAKLGDGLAGLIFVETLGETIQNCVRALEERHYPVVVANLEDDLAVSATWVDHASYIRQAVEVLASLGHRRIAYVGQDSPLIYYPRLLRAYEEAMASHGLPTDKSLLALTETNSGAAAYRAVRAMLVAPNPPTAIVSARDLYAEGACHAVEDIGAEVGRDISVFGFDNISWQSREPYVTTFQEPCYEMGTVAAEMLIERITHGWRPVEKREIKAKLIMRRSVGPAPKSALDLAGASPRDAGGWGDSALAKSGLGAK